MTEDTDKFATYNPYLEQTVIGALLRNNNIFDEIAEWLNPDIFYQPSLKIVYEWIYKSLMEGNPVNALSLAHHADTNSVIKEEGGAKYLMKLQDLPISFSIISSQAKILYDLYLKRSALHMAEDLIEDVKKDADISGENLLLQSENQVYQLLTAGPTSGRLTPFDKLAAQSVTTLKDFVKSGQKILGVSSGLSTLDHLTGGFYQSDLIIIASRPGMGKTALALNFANNAAKIAKNSQKKNGNPVSGASVLLFSLEMSSEQLTRRILSLQTNIKSSKLRTAHLNQQDIATLQNSLSNIQDLPLFIDDTPNLSIDKLRIIAKRMQRQENISMIIVDYLQLLVSPNYYKSHNRVEEITEISRSLKIIAKELDVPVIALSQLSRSVESREDKRPQLSDLRDSGSIEQDADCVMFLYRPVYYMRKPEHKAGESDEGYDKRMNDYLTEYSKIEHTTHLIVEKQRHGPIGSIELHFDQDYMKFQDKIDNLWETEKEH